MAGVLTLLDQPRTLNALGNATSAIIYFYNTGTTTLAPIYTNAALTIPAANPVVLSAGQIFPDTYLDATLTYRRRIVFGDGTIHDIDPYPIGVTATILGEPAGASLIGYANSEGTGSVTAPVSEKLGEVMSLRDKGARGVSAATDSAALTSAFAAMTARTPRGGLVVPGTRLIKLDGSFAMPRETRLDMTGAVIQASSTSRLFDFGWGTTGTANTVGRGEIVGGRWDLTGSGASFVGIQNAGTARFRDIDLNLLSSNQVGFHLKACNDPHAPYYGNMSDNRVRGNASPGSGQIGYLLEGLPELGSLTINRWTINNASDCAAVDIGWDIRGADGLVLNNINTESCYTSAFRFGATNRSITTTVTTPGATPSSFTATGLIGSTLDQAATIIINSGPNINQSCRIISYDTVTGLVILPPGMPYKFTAGDSFTITEAKARNVGVSNATFEGGTPTAAVVDFTAGALACEVGFRMVSVVDGSLMRRAVADVSNTIARQYDTYVVEKKLTVGGGVENFESDWTASNQGGFVLPRGGWIDAIYVSGFIRGFDTSDGEIEIDVLANGTVVPNVVAKLTRHSPNFGRAVRLTLTNGDFLPAGANIQVRAFKIGMAIAERVQAQIVIGYL